MLIDTLECIIRCTVYICRYFSKVITSCKTLMKIFDWSRQIAIYPRHCYSDFNRRLASSSCLK